MSSSEIRHVSDTALWVAMYRAFESERPDALFRDPFARRMAGERGAAIVEALPRGRAMAWPMIVRTAVMDEILLRLVAGGVRTVLNIAAGLDTRAYRLPLPPDLRWFDVDLPDMIAYRREHLGSASPVCRHEDVAADMTDDAQRAAVLARVGGDGPALALTEGLLIYLAADQVAALARQLHGVPGLDWWLIDLASPLLLKFLERTWQPELQRGNAPMKFAPPEGTSFFEAHGWREAEFRSTWTESLRLRRSVRFARFWDALGKLRPAATRAKYERMSGIVLLERH